LRLAGEIRRQALAWAVAEASVDEIDRLHILQASLLAMQRAVSGLIAQYHLLPGQILVDGTHCPVFTAPAQAVIGGDGRICQIAAASILAKTVRDAGMQELHATYPQYGFDRHKGYPTAAHLRALQDNGPCPQHRRSFAPVARLLRA